MSIERIGVGIISFDRPHYLARLVGSLEANLWREAVDFYLFQDGAVNVWSERVAGSGEGIRESVELFEGSTLGGAVVLQRVGNVGIAVNEYGALEHLVARHEWVLILEDDVVVSPYYLRLARVLFGQLEDREEVGAFSLGFKKLCRLDEMRANLDKIMYTCGHWWGDGLWASKWGRARPFYEEYMALVQECDYVARPHFEIRSLFMARGWPAMNTTQDAAKDMAISAAGMERVRAVVNRGISIGERGQHFRPGQFRALGFQDQEPYVFESDAVLDRFEWRG